MQLALTTKAPRLVEAALRQIVRTGYLALSGCLTAIRRKTLPVHSAAFVHICRTVWVSLIGGCHTNCGSFRDDCMESDFQKAVLTEQIVCWDKWIVGNQELANPLLIAQSEKVYRPSSHRFVPPQAR